MVDMTAMPTATKIVEATLSDLDDWVRMALKLWPAEEDSPERAEKEMRAELSGILQSAKDTALIARDDQRRAIAFVNLSICYEYVPGAKRFPVAYIEGIYVANIARKTGVGRALVAEAELWAKAKGCTQLASDVMIENTESCQFHTRVGFQEVERVVFFIKDVEQL